MSKRGGKTALPMGSPDQDSPAAPPLPSTGNPVGGIQPDDSIDPVMNQGGRNTEDLLAETKQMLEDVTEQLREEIEAHSRTKLMAKKREAKFKIFEQAETGHELRAKDLLASLDSSERKRELEAERWLHARKLIVALEASTGKGPRARVVTMPTGGGNGSRDTYEAAIQPLIRQTRA